MLKFSKAAFLLLIFSLPFMKVRLPVGGYYATAADMLFLVAAGGLTIAIARRQARLRWDPLYAILLAYFATMLASTAVAENPPHAWLKLATQLYLLCLPLLAASLIESVEELRAVLRTWLAATAVTAALGAITVLLFAIGIENPLAGYALHEFGTLPPGNYPRIESTFDFPAMLCNYLTVSLMILLVTRYFGWIGRTAFWFLLAAIGVTASFTLTPGLGGIFLALGLWGYLFLPRRPAKLALAASVMVAVAFLLAATVTPIIHPTAPFLIDLPGLGQVTPSVRMMTWMDSGRQFMEHPLLGAGIGANAAEVRYVDPSGIDHLLTDAHNVFLDVAAQCGLAGLAAVTLLIIYVAKKAKPVSIDRDQILRFTLAAAWLNAFVYQGLTGSYEDARHLWLLLGILVVADRLMRESGEMGNPAIPQTSVRAQYP
jgi:putative inorganic carbon (hco3(-)) transporter